MKKNLVLILILLPFLVQSQDDKQKASLRNAQTQVEGLAKMVITEWDPASAYYRNAQFKYIEVQGAFNEWIDFCSTQGELSINNKKHKVDEAGCTLLAESAMGKYTELKEYITVNYDSAMNTDARGLPVFETATSVVDLLNNFIGLLGENKKAKKEEQLVKLKGKLESYKVKSWDELKGEGE